MMTNFGDNIICVDTTYRTNIYDFNLITVMVLDEYGEGIPVAWAVCNREDMCALVQIFKYLKKRTGLLQPEVFMSNDAEQFWNAWVGVYGANRTRKLFCAWHIDRTWRDALNKHISNQEQRITIYHHLQVLLTQQDEIEFKVKLQQFLSHVKNFTNTLQHITAIVYKNGLFVSVNGR